MAKKKTHEEFVEEVYNLVGDEFSVTGTYINTQTKIEIRHNNEECNFCTFTPKPANFIRGQRCPVCTQKIVSESKKGLQSVRKTNTEFQKEIYAKVGDAYTLLSEYKTNKDKIHIQHNNESCCNYSWWVAPNSFLNGVRCPKCSNVLKLTHKEFLIRVNNLVGTDYTILSEYKNSASKVKIRHNCKECDNHEYVVTPAHFLNNRRCPKCKGLKTGVTTKHSQDWFDGEVNSLVGCEYTFLESYNGISKKIKVRHNSDKCNNNEYYVTPEKFINRGRRCPVCRGSKGEYKVAKLLTDLNIKFSQQDYVYAKDGSWVISDFLIYDTSNKVIFAIEYDGEQHYKPIKFFGGEDSLKLTKERDDRKNTIFKDAGIPLLRIPYWEFDNITSVLANFLKDHNYLDVLDQAWSDELELLLKVSEIPNFKELQPINTTVNIHKEISYDYFKVGEVLDIESTVHYTKKDVAPYVGEGKSINYIIDLVVDNGVYDKVILDDSYSINKGNELTYCPRSCEFYYQEDPYISGRSIYKLCVKNKNVGLYLATVLNKLASASGYGFQNKLTLNILKELSIRLPINEQGDINYSFMEHYIDSIKAEVIYNLDLEVKRKMKLIKESLSTKTM